MAHAHADAVGSGRHLLARPRTVRSREGTARLWAAMASADAFGALGVRALYGRTLMASDEADPDVAVLGFEASRRLFAAPPAVGTTIELEAPETMFAGAVSPRLLTVVGVLPAGVIHAGRAGGLLHADCPRCERFSERDDDRPAARRRDACRRRSTRPTCWAAPSARRARRTPRL